ncbi:MAG: UDP-N-acetylmuramoyl-tripeptide--D-alanyl-D-alanine ligase [Verrucomicrobia bacterium]|nr:MAG: UDP-N-acetylmuramoyl-tripeptide--D-alanyl-D-alanine ligase [Verrucomicrobiota bacterium]
MRYPDQRAKVLTMDALSLHRIAEFAAAEIARGNGETTISRVSTDSRTIKRGDLFVALRGEHFDAHNFLEQVAKAGAAGALVSQDPPPGLPQTFAILRAADTLLAYQNLAANYRKTLLLKVLGVTGSNGKTSTKDFAGSILGRAFRVTKTEGNFNNHVGLPRTMLEANRDHQFAVWELGMNHPGEIGALARIASPDAGIITNIGIAHIEFMGSREAIAQEKGALAEAIDPGGFVVLNADDEFSGSIADRTRARVIFAGIEEGAIRAIEVQQTAGGCEFTIVEGAHRCRAQLPVPGLHMVQNAILAVAAGRAFGVSLEECAAGLVSAPLAKARLQIREIHGVQFIDDSYNANPDSMKAALRTLVELDADGKRIAVLGRMLELGAESERGHREVGETAATLGIDYLIAIAEETIASAAEEAGLRNTAVAKDAAAAAEMLNEIVGPGDLVLIKGSRSARTELVLDEFAKFQPVGGNIR